MVTLEQVKLLESKVVKALSYIGTLSAENATLREKLDGYRRRIDELETIVLAFKEDQGRIEAGIVSALERLNQFEDAVERGISDVKTVSAEPQPNPQTEPSPELSFISSAGAFSEPLSEEPIAEEAEPIMDMPEEKPLIEKNGELDIF